MTPKDISYIIIGTMTILGNIVAIVWAFSWMKFQLREMGKNQEKIMAILYPENGKLQFQSITQCADFRALCRNEICAFVKEEMKEQRETIKRIHQRLDEMDMWYPRKGE